MPRPRLVPRRCAADLNAALAQFPVVALLGPRQCGKSTLARQVTATTQAVYLDLELPSDLAKLTDAEAYLRANHERLVCLDEIQRRPELFPVLRALVDRDRRPGRFLVLGSASPELLRQGSETLAGRIAFLHLTPFLLTELDAVQRSVHWLRGGFPDSLLASDEAASFRWRQNFIATYLSRDLRDFGINLSPETMRRLWTMLAHANAGVLNAAKLAGSLGVSSPTVRRYVDFLAETFLVRVLRPWHANVGKRLVKSPKVLLTDTGLLHALLDIEEHNQLFGHPVYGSSWESHVVGQLCGALPDWTPYHYRTARGDEIDLLLARGDRLLAVECKASSAPQVERGYYRALDDLGLERGYVVAPVEEDAGYPLNDRAEVLSPLEFLRRHGGG